MTSLLDLYRETLARCAPEMLVRRVVTPDMPRTVVAIGKCAGALLDGVAAVHPVNEAFVALPSGYPHPKSTWGQALQLALPPKAAHRAAAQAGELAPTLTQVAIGGHPDMTPASFDAGRRLLAFVEQHDDILFLISGGGSACVEVPLPPFTEDEVAAANKQLVASNKTIAEINAERRTRSAIKGGKLREHVRGRAVTLVYSDVSNGALADVASGPTITRNEDAILIADNDTLTATAVAIANATRWNGQLECDVDEAARLLADRARTLRSGEILVAGGEPTVERKGDGKGGRCSELALRFALHEVPGVAALFGSSDGVDGSSGVAGILLPANPRLNRNEIVRALERSDSFPVAAQVGEPIMIAATGNNLRDLYLLARE